MNDTDIEGLSPKDATEYVLAFITTLKQTEKERAAADEEAALWTRRVELARSKGEEALASQAQARVDQCTARRAQLDAELADLKGKVAILKEKLTRLRMTGGKSIDADLLLAQLEMVVGKKDELSKTFKDEESNAALDELKKKMGR